MAVVQISKLQARRGLHQDLPQLASGELGWSIDQRRLFIGNGTLTEGAPTEGITEILTNYTNLAAVLKNYTFQGNAGGYTAQTGSSLLNPTVRSFQDKLDDHANVKDFGATGDGTTDDTAAINRAITQIYLSTRNANHPSVRRTIYFPAGTYIVTGNVLLVPPWLSIKGDGIESTVIKQTDATQNCLLQFSDSLFQTGANLGNNGATTATFVDITGVTLENTTDHDVVKIDSASNVTFNQVEFKGPLTDPTTASTNMAGVRLLSFASTTQNITFNLCNFTNVRNGIASSDRTRDVRVVASRFNSVYKGITLGENSIASTAPVNYLIMNCVFARVANKAIDCYSNVTNVVSSGNHYLEVGNNYAGTGNAVSPVINFTNGGNYSVADSFDRTDADHLVYSRVEFNSAQSVSLQANVGLILNSVTLGTGGVYTLLDNQSVTVSTGIRLPNPCIVTYSITRDTTIRTGTIAFANDGTGAQYTENFTSSTVGPGITLIVNSSNVITYISTSTGSNATFKYNITSF